MGELIPINLEFKESIEQLKTQVDRGEITHAVIVYRTTDGALMWKTLGHEHKSYLIGLSRRVQHRLEHLADEEGQWSDG